MREGQRNTTLSAGSLRANVVRGDIRRVRAGGQAGGGQAVSAAPLRPSNSTTKVMAGAICAQYSTWGANLFVGVCR